MPKLVDHAKRRTDIAALTVSVIQKIGIENATVRRIAREGGFSVGVLSHYFQDKDELLGFAFNWQAEEVARLIEEGVQGTRPGIERLRRSLQVMIPKDEDAPTAIVVWLNFWARANHSPKLAAQHQQLYSHWRSRVQAYLEEAIEAGEAVRPASLEDAADLLISGMDGLWIAMTLEPKRFPPRRRQALVRKLVDDIAGSPAKGRAARRPRAGQSS